MEERVNQPPIYTIGYGKRSIEECIDLLRRYTILYLVDIRSQPYSRYQPTFSKAALEKKLQEAGLRYIFLGNKLGGRPADASCYVNDKVDYTRLREKSFYQEGIARLLKAREKGACMALLCSEQRPEECHRSKLIGQTLHARGVEVAHIDETGELKSQEAVDLALSGGQLSLFDDPALTPKMNSSRKKYSLGGEKI